MSRLNLRLLAAYGRAAIVTYSNYQLSLLEEALRVDFPEVMGPWEKGELADFKPELDTYGQDWIGFVTVAPHIFDDDFDIAQVADESYWSDRGYTLIDFDLLLEDQVDYGEFDPVSLDIKSLFGMG